MLETDYGSDYMVVEGPKLPALQAIVPSHHPVTRPHQEAAGMVAAVVVVMVGETTKIVLHLGACMMAVAEATVDDRAILGEATSLSWQRTHHGRAARTS